MNIKILIIVLLSSASINVFGQDTLLFRSDFLDSIKKVIHLDTLERERREGVLPNIGQNPILYSIHSFVDLGKVQNEYKQVPFHLMENIHFLKHKEQKNKTFRNTNEKKVIFYTSRGSYYQEYTTQKIHQLRCTNTKNNRERVLKERKDETSVVKGVSCLFNYHSIKNQSSTFEKYNTIQWLLQEGSIGELVGIIQTFDFPVLQFYAYRELVSRGVKTRDLNTFLSKEYVLLCFGKYKKKIIRLQYYLKKTKGIYKRSKT
ncbi:MAG: hypothetical protein ACRBFS_11960 [Aureispira sp.]